MKNIALRPAQAIAIPAGVKAVKATGRALLVMATALGKTLTSAVCAKKLRARKVLFLAHTNFIVSGAMSKDYALVYDKKRMSLYNGMQKKGAKEATVVFATWQTMLSNISDWDPGHFDLIVVDEAHHSEAPTWKAVLRHFKANRIALTATPDREDDADIRGEFGEPVVNFSLEESIARGWLPPIEYHIVADGLDEEALAEIIQEIREAHRKFNMAEVNRRLFIKKRDKEVARMLNAVDESMLVFCASIPDSERMAKLLRKSAFLHSETGKNQRESWDINQKILKDLGEGKIRRVTAVNGLNEGVDVPSVGMVVLRRATESIRIFLQQLGRGLRWSEGKNKLIVWDFVGNLQRLKDLRDMMERIADFHEQFSSESDRAREHYEHGTFEVSGASFKFKFEHTGVEMEELFEVINNIDSEYYTFEEACHAVRVHGWNSQPMYRRNYSQDIRLPANPDKRYKGKGWTTWPNFLGIEKTEMVRGSEFYSYQEACVAARALKISDNKDYRTKRKKDPRLPSTPEKYYEGAGWTTWLDFLGKSTRWGNQRKTTTKEPTCTFEDARQSVQRLGITNARDYAKRRSQDPNLPANPDRCYKGRGWTTWSDFLGKK
jgi:superfamily II DNA or RNA helicase